MDQEANAGSRKAGGSHNPPDRARGAGHWNDPPGNGADVIQVTHPKNEARSAKRGER